MTPDRFNRLQSLRMENTARGYSLSDLAPRFAALAGRHENGTAPRAVVAHQLFQTPPPLAARLVAMANIRAGHRVLEPSAGLGRLLDAAHENEPAAAVVAVEIDPGCVAELHRAERSQATARGCFIHNRDFLTCTPADLDTFDRVIMNPPFTMRADISHILYALQFVKSGGSLAALCLDTHHRRDALRDRAHVWEELPEDTFKAEGTRVKTCLMLITV